MGNYLPFVSVILPFLILIIPGKAKYTFTLFVTTAILIFTSLPAWQVLLNGKTHAIIAEGPAGMLQLFFDPLSSFFILVTNFIVLAGLLYAKGYMNPVGDSGVRKMNGLHLLSFSALHLSMLGVLVIHDGIAFLIAWELMAVSSFLLILYEAEKRSTLKTAVSYLVQMHVGLFLLLTGFLVGEDTSGNMSFETLTSYFSNHSGILVFFIFFAGFAIKAGFVPFHTWLPEAHPAAPSHVSGVMSGVMVKMGIYGILRVTFSLQSDHLTVGVILLCISAVTALWGIIQSVTYTDMKKVLACSTIENIGIIGLGIGMGLTGIGLQNHLLSTLGFTGALYHLLSHSLFKSLLFFGTGSIYKATHTRNLEDLGGLSRVLPLSSGLFLLGSAAICALPPLNGFISEFLLYNGILEGIATHEVGISVLFMLLLIVLVLTGGLAIFSFTRMFGIAFLGSPRKELQVNSEAVTRSMILPQLMIAVMILLTGLAPMAFIDPVSRIAGFFTGHYILPDHTGPVFRMITTICMILILLAALLFFVRKVSLRKKRVVSGPTWGCGYTAGTSRQQYTATSYGNAFTELTGPLPGQKHQFVPFSEEEVFPKMRSFTFQGRDAFAFSLGWLTGISLSILKNLARLQTGNIRHYILYAFIFMLLLFLLIFLKVL